MKQNNNIENQFKQKLNQRTIEPTDKAWDRLDAMLSVSEQKKPKRAWLWIAASLVALVTIGSLFFRTDNSELITNDALITNYELQMTSDELRITNDEIITEQTPKIVLERKKSTLTTFNGNDNLNFNDNSNNENTEIASIETETSTYVTAQELLSEIKNDIHITEQNKKTSVTINHKSLLYQAEMEVETQYQNKAFDRFLQKKYDDARMAVINKF